MSACNPFLPDELVFPRRPTNRPGLSHIEYRVGAYPELLDVMRRHIDGAVELAAWTHRAPDDPGIALLESAATLGDVLTFYQERYANEAFLRTAEWRESVARLVRLLGYRPAPGLGGRGTFALDARGHAPVTVPAGLPIKADLKDAAEPAHFRTVEEVTAYPFLSSFHLYRNRVYPATLPADAASLEVTAAEGDPSQAARSALDLKPGDRLVLVAAPPAFLQSGASFTGSQKPAQVVSVKAVRTLLGRTLVDLDAPLVSSWTGPVDAYRIGRSFRHFGHAAPSLYTTNVTSSGVITGARERTTDYARHLDAHNCTLTGLVGGIPGAEFALERQVDDLDVGGRVVVQAKVTRESTSGVKEVTLARTVTAAAARTLEFASLTAPSTVLTLDAPLSPNGSLKMDVRDIQMHEVTSPRLTVRAPAVGSGGAFPSGVDALSFYGTLSQVRALAGRRLLLEADGREPLELRSVDPPEAFDALRADPLEPRMWPLSFDRAPAPFTRADFDEEEPTVRVSGNLVDADQGKDEGEAVLGSGDGRAVLQTFPLPAAPLTWHLSASGTPPRVPRLEVRVEGRLWTRVDALYGRGPTDEVYVVRTGEDGRSYVQFGDGRTGARLPTGLKNVRARYATGVGSHGPLASGAKPSAGQRVDGLERVRLPGVVHGGSEPESAEVTRRAAPGRVQGMGRLVSLADYESEVLAVGGVSAAAASWDLHDGVPTVVLRVLLESGREGEFADVRAAVQGFQRCRGPDRFPLVVLQVTLRWTFLDLRYAFDPALEKEPIESRLRAALGVTGGEPATDDAATGLFGVSRRRPGAREYARRIEGVVQNVEGVTWCRVSGLGLLPPSVADPGDAVLPAVPRPRAASVAPGPDQVLQLHVDHLDLTTAPVPPGGECDA